MRNKRTKASLVIVAAFFLTGCAVDDAETSVVSGNWVRQSDFEGVTRSGAVSFTVENYAYVGLGFDGSDYLKDFWRYDPELNFWQRISDFPGEGRIGSVGLSIAGKGYVGTGYNNNLEKEELKDFWSYDPGTDTWEQMADLAGEERYLAVAFAIHDRGYIGTGFNGNFLKDFWRYDPVTNNWEQIVSIYGSKRESATAFVIDGKAYVGSGRNNGVVMYDFWEYDPEVQQWVDLTLDSDDESFAEFYSAIGRYSGVSFEHDGYGYMGLGITSTYSKAIYRYDPVTNQWSEITAFEAAARSEATSFTVSDKVFVVTGRNSSQRFDDLWQLKPGEEYDETD